MPCLLSSFARTAAGRLSAFSRSQTCLQTQTRRARSRKFACSANAIDAQPSPRQAQTTQPTMTGSDGQTGSEPRQSRRLLRGRELLDAVDVFVFDCDGVIWRGDEAISGAADALAHIRKEGKRIFFVTNNSTKSRAGYLKKFQALGLHAEEEEIFSSSFGAAVYLQSHPLPQHQRNVYVVGQQGIMDELTLAGIPCFGGPNDNDKVVRFGSEGGMKHDPSVGAVVVGLDTSINYYKLQYAQLCLRENPGCTFIATNLDATAHLTADQEWAGGGTMVAAVSACSGRSPVLVGKPSPLLIDLITTKYAVDRSRVCMVGDRLDTDIQFGLTNGLRTVLTLSGVTSEETLTRTEASSKPEFVVDSIVDLMRE